MSKNLFKSYRSSDSVRHFFGNRTEVLIETRLLGRLREECGMALYGLGKGAGPVVEKSEDQLTAYTRSDDTPQGLDFSTEEGSGRFTLYRLREEIQEHYGLYFSSVNGVGLKFTIHPMIGMQWRERDFDDRAKNAAQQLVRMWSMAIDALGERGLDGKREIMDAVRGRAAMLAQTSNVIQSKIVIDIGLAKKDPPSAPKKRAVQARQSA